MTHTAAAQLQRSITQVDAAKRYGVSDRTRVEGNHRDERDRFAVKVPEVPGSTRKVGTETCCPKPERNRDGLILSPMNTYFIQAVTGGPIKIGKSRTIHKRVAALQLGNPETLVCFALIPGNCEFEIHERFHDLCVGGEWFRPGPELLAYIDENAFRTDVRKPARSPQYIKLVRDCNVHGGSSVRLEDLPEYHEKRR